MFVFVTQKLQKKVIEMESELLSISQAAQNQQRTIQNLTDSLRTKDTEASTRTHTHTHSPHPDKLIFMLSLSTQTGEHTHTLIQCLRKVFIAIHFFHILLHYSLILKLIKLIIFLKILQTIPNNERSFFEIFANLLKIKITCT